MTTLLVAVLALAVLLLPASIGNPASALNVESTSRPSVNAASLHSCVYAGHCLPVRLAGQGRGFRYTATHHPRKLGVLWRTAGDELAERRNCLLVNASSLRQSGSYRRWSRAGRLVGGQSHQSSLAIG